MKKPWTLLVALAVWAAVARPDDVPPPLVDESGSFADVGGAASGEVPPPLVDESGSSADVGGAASGGVPPIKPLRIADRSALPRPKTGEGPIYVLPVEGEIEGALVYVFRRGLREAEQTGARAIVLDMDTPGGNLGSIWKIMELLQRSPVPTYTYVNPNAISGGALIALATDHVVMAPGSLIGDAKPILGSPLPFGAPQDIPEGLREKVLSPALAKVRAACQRTGRDPDVGVAMMDESLELVRDGEVICAEGRILTLTNEEAQRLYGDPPKPLLSEGTFETLEELLDQLGRSPGAEGVRTLRVTSSERIARVLAGPLSPLLLGLGLLLLYIEVRTPGFGVPGLSGLLVMGLWFWGQHIAALAGMGELILFLLGVVLLAVEVFLIPGFGITGIAGLVLMAAGVIAAMVPRLPGPGPFTFPPDMLSAAILNFTLSLVVFSAGIWALGGLLPKVPAFRRLTLQAVVDGHSAAAPSAVLQPGVQGLTISPCRPGGVGRFANERVDVVSTGEFLESGSPVELVARRATVWEVRPLPKA